MQGPGFESGLLRKFPKSSARTLWGIINPQYSKGWSPIYDEYIPGDSPRLAPAAFFTGREDIPRYLLNGNGNCRFAYVVVGQDAANRLTEQLIDLVRDELQQDDIMFEERDLSIDMEEMGDEEENNNQGQNAGNAPAAQHDANGQGDPNALGDPHNPANTDNS